MITKNNITRYAVLGLGRSGTTAIHFALKGHPNVSALNDEVKVSFFSEGISSFTQRDDNEVEKEIGTTKLFDAITGVFSDGKTVAHGLKCVPADIDDTALLVNSIRQHYPDLKIVLLKRNDLTAQYGSMLRAQKTGEWHSWRLNKNTGNVSIKISRQLFKKYIKRSLSKFDLLDGLRNSHDLLIVDYEQSLLRDAGPNFSEVFHFLNLPDLPVTWLNCEKVAPPPEEYILNYHKMKDLYIGFERPQTS
ncbi:MAG: hypothetical protein JKY18_02620 [Flavobacteriales bacterium]|nr:hypothetical protein [Flavobacteriales bacterium]